MDGANIDFLVPDAGQQYIDVSGSFMRLQCRVLTQAGDKIPPWYPEDPDTPDICRTSVINSLYASLWDNAQVYMN